MGRTVVATTVPEELFVRQGEPAWLPVVTATTVLAGLVAARKGCEMREEAAERRAAAQDSCSSADETVPLASTSSSPPARPAEIEHETPVAIASATPAVRGASQALDADDTTEPGLTPTPLACTSPPDAMSGGEEPIASAAVPKVLWADDYDGKSPMPKADDAECKADEFASGPVAPIPMKTSTSVCWADESSVSDSDSSSDSDSESESSESSKSESSEPVREAPVEVKKAYSSWADECETDSADEELAPRPGALRERDANSTAPMGRKECAPESAPWRPKHQRGNTRGPPPTACHVSGRTTSASTITTLRTAASSIAMCRDESTVTTVSTVHTVAPSPPRTPSHANAALTAASSPEPRSPPPLFAMPDTPARETPVRTPATDRCPPLYPVTPQDCPPWRQEAPISYDAPMYQDGAYDDQTYGHAMGTSGEYSCAPTEESPYAMGASQEWCEGDGYTQYPPQYAEGTYGGAQYDANGYECGYDREGYGYEYADASGACYQDGYQGEWQGQEGYLPADGEMTQMCGDPPQVRKVDARWADAAPFYPGSGETMPDPPHPLAGQGYEGPHATGARYMSGGERVWRGAGAPPAKGRSRGGKGKGGKGISASARGGERPRPQPLSDRWEWGTLRQETAREPSPPPSPLTQSEMRSSGWASPATEKASETTPSYAAGTKSTMRISSAVAHRPAARSSATWDTARAQPRGARGRAGAWGGGSGWSPYAGGKGRQAAAYPA